MQAMTGRLVTQEEKEELIKQRSQLEQGKASNTFTETTFYEHRQQRASSGSSTSSYVTGPAKIGHICTQNLPYF